MTMSPRHSVRGALLGAVAVLGCLVACGDDDATEGSGPRTVTSDTGAFPVTLEHKYGTTVIPEAPERVLTAGFKVPHS